jgi:hypothetical protein
MAYTLYNSDGTILAIIADGEIDQHSTNLTLIGKNVTSYGQYLNENFITVLSNGASSDANRTVNPVNGQLWYDSINSRLSIYDPLLCDVTRWRNVIGAEINDTLPATLGIGDFWFDRPNKQLKIKINASSSTWVVGPAFSSTIGENGWVLPGVALPDSFGNAQNVTLLKNYGTTIGAISANEFNITTATSKAYFGTQTNISTVVAGLNIVGDISYTGKFLDNYVSVTLNLETLSQYTPDPTGLITHTYDYANIRDYQNPAIANFLNMTFPPSGNSLSTLVNEPGLPLGTEARVICQSYQLTADPAPSLYAIYGGGTDSQYQGDIHARRFRIVYDQAAGENRWDAVNIYLAPGSAIALTNVIPDTNPTPRYQRRWFHVPV